MRGILPRGHTESVYSYCPNSVIPVQMGFQSLVSSWAFLTPLFYLSLTIDPSESRSLRCLYLLTRAFLSTLIAVFCVSPHGLTFHAATQLFPSSNEAASKNSLLSRVSVRSHLCICIDLFSSQHVIEVEVAMLFNRFLDSGSSLSV